MEPSTKKGLIIVSAILVVGGVISYLYFKNKNDYNGVDNKIPGAVPQGGSTSNDTKIKTNGAVTQQKSATTKNTTAPSTSSPATTNTNNSSQTVLTPIASPVYSTGDSVNIRSAPSTSGKVVGKVNKGDKIGVSAGKQIGDWLAVYSTNSNGAIVYVNNAYAKIQ